MNPLLTAAIAALFPLVVGFVWYNPKVFGNAWLKSINMTEEQMKGANMAVIFGLTYVFSFILAFALTPVVIHQYGVISLVTDHPAGKMPQNIVDAGKNLLTVAGLGYNTFKHGALHGGISAVLFALPILGINALFERRGAKYIFIHLGYWFITMVAMGAFICHFSAVPVLK